MRGKRAYDAVVIGAGAAGLMAAGTCTDLGLRVLVLEQMPRPGVKLLVTGGGRCNLTNTRSPDEIMEAFGRQGRFMAPALARLGPDELRRLFQSRGVETVAREDGCVFPVTDSAASVLEALLARLDPRKSTLLTESRVTRILTDQGRAAGVRTRDGIYRAGAVVLAAGGKSYPGLGGSGGGYALAATLGHTVQAPLPALVPLVTRESWPGGLAGIGLTEVETRLTGKASRNRRARGGLIFTHEGLSGPAVLDISGSVAALLQNAPAVELTVDLFPAAGPSAWRDRFDEWRRTAGGARIVKLLQDYMPLGLAVQLCALSGADPAVTAGRLSRAQLDRLAGDLTGLKFTITGTAGFDKAMITRGGVSLKEVSPDSLESKLIKRLYLCGEVLDLDGPCGGYNLQWAFSSGWLAGESCARGGG